MRNIKFLLWGYLGTLTFFLSIAAIWPKTFSALSIRSVMIDYTGVHAVGAMSLTMMLALRPVWLESWLNGLDKSYRLHKWLGISTLVLSVMHWLSGNAPKWATALGLLEPPERGPRPEESALPPLQQWFNTQRDTAEFIGEWTFYVFVLLITIALIKHFPYRLFAKTHTVLAVAYLAIVFHGIILMEYSYWLQPVGVASGLLMAAGSIAATLILMGRIGRNRKVAGTIEHIDLFPDLNIMETSIRLDDGWKGHQGGQFAFVTFDAKEGAHPFTIGSAWNREDPCINFITKGLGDYTNLMVENLKIGDKVTVEGPYGRFIFSDGKKRQIWIGGGIGITPFIARMKQLAHEPKDQAIDLFHTIPFKDPKAHQKMSTDVKAANVQLHLLVDGQDDRLTGEMLRAQIPDWKEASFWFCGPAKFGESLKKDLIANGLKEQDFHQELFNMR